MVFLHYCPLSVIYKTPALAGLAQVNLSPATIETAQDLSQGQS